MTFEVGHDQSTERIPSFFDWWPETTHTRAAIYVGGTRRIFKRLSVHGYANLPYDSRQGREALLGATVHLRSGSAFVRPNIRASHWWRDYGDHTALFGVGVRVGRQVGGAVSLDIRPLTGGDATFAYLVRAGVYVKLWGPTS